MAYRLAPEHRFPAAVDDAAAAYRWLLGWGADPGRLTVAGDSAGGGLTLATALTARDEGLPLPAALAAMSPSVDLEGTGESFRSRAADDPLIQLDFLLKTARLYLDGADLAGLPPLLIQAGTLETLLDDSRRLAERARAAGVETTLRVWDGMFHGWQLYARMLPEGQEAIEEVAEFVREKTARRPPK